MRVLWDQGSKIEDASGIGRYSRCLQGEFQRFADVNLQVLNPTEVLQSTSLRRFSQLKVIWPHCLSSYLRQSNLVFDVFHGLANINLPFLLPRKKRPKAIVVTVHDIIPLLASSGCSVAYKLQFKWLLPKVVGLADAIVCPSKWTWNHLATLFPWAEGKLQLISNGVPNISPNWQGQQERGQRTKLLVVSRFEPYKRLDFLLKLVEFLPDCQLTLVTDKVGARRFCQEKSSRVRILTNLSQPALEQLYIESDLFLHSSLYEGFGLPPLEAARLGTPVIYQKGNALDEYLDPTISLGLEMNASMDIWIEAGKANKAWKWVSTFQQQWQNAVLAMPSWANSADRLKELYNEYK